MPAVSIIVPVYKVEEYITQCAQALFGQTLKDIEYIFVDDCSPDCSMERLEQVLEGCPQRQNQVKIIHNETNRGIAYTRRVGSESATGEYIIHCDSDDWPEPEMYAKMYSKAKEEDLDMVICKTCCVFPDHIESSVDRLGSKDTLGALIRQEMYNHVTDKLVSRKAYDRGITWPEDNMSEDTAMLIQLACNCDSFGYLYEPLYNYRCREGSISRSEYNVDKIGQMRRNYDLAISCLEANGLSGRYKRDILHLKCFLKSACQYLPKDFYMELYPETNLAFLFDGRFTVMQRLGHLTKMLGIHGISKVFAGKK